MKSLHVKLAKSVAAAVAISLLSSCSVPRVGPTKEEVFSGSVQRSGDSFVVSVDDRVLKATAVQKSLGFSDSFKSAGLIGSDTINPGDTLGLTIWENVDDGLLTSEIGGQTPLEEVQVDGEGFIFVPYAGRIRAAGNTPEGVRRIITNKLQEQTPDPQVQVRRVAGNGSTVSLLGGVGAQGVYPIERPTRTLSRMISAAGGISIEPETALVSVLRGNKKGTIWFQDLFKNPQYDIPLRSGDRVVIEQDTRTYTALGATGAQSHLPFRRPVLSAAEAIAGAGGLSPQTGDPTGVFILRNEPAEIANQVMGRSDLQGSQRLVYVVDITEANGLFMLRDFNIRNGDTIYVTEAPFARWGKVAGALTGTLGAIGSFSTAGDTLGL
ncbi:Polysaccharide biosynthesis/export protein [Roseovarius albus]|uniref:Polysaccharide biosynthesis/export protein n=1 Tax=Roseovarius albus TaxID=1247867 RepID=A0A1X6Z8C1_9RHOB|nr:polysaccharide biosynthesis/export family protein [Roseovarius albus]SLN43996.1 Polysaccharide biosynthesis/export protein [Roseovarius albus]